MLPWWDELVSEWSEVLPQKQGWAGEATEMGWGNGQVGWTGAPCLLKAVRHLQVSMLCQYIFHLSLKLCISLLSPYEHITMAHPAVSKSTVNPSNSPKCIMSERKMFKSELLTWSSLNIEIRCTSTEHFIIPCWTSPSPGEEEATVWWLQETCTSFHWLEVELGSPSQNWTSVSKSFPTFCTAGVMTQSSEGWSETATVTV